MRALQKHGDATAALFFIDINHQTSRNINITLTSVTKGLKLVSIDIVYGIWYTSP